MQYYTQLLDCSQPLDFFKVKEGVKETAREASVKHEGVGARSERSILRWRPVLSRCFSHVQRSRKIRENRGLETVRENFNEMGKKCMSKIKSRHLLICFYYSVLCRSNTIILF